MLPSKLFAIAAAIFSICAALARLVPVRAGMDIYVHGTYFVYGPVLLFLFCAVASANFALLYYAAVRFFDARWNRLLSLLHFFLFVWFGISLSIVFVIAARAANESEAAGTTLWLVIHWFTGILGLVLSLAVFGVNLALTIIQLVRTRFAIH